MAAIDNTQATVILKAMLAITALITPFEATSPITVALGSTAPTSSVAMTAIVGTGYSRLTAAWNTVSGTPPTTTLSGALTWTNSSGGAWSIVGAELWDSAGTPLRWFFGSWNGQPIGVANGNAFQVASGATGISVSLS
jgi:hypothetical protein